MYTGLSTSRTEKVTGCLSYAAGEDTLSAWNVTDSSETKQFLFRVVNRFQFTRIVTAAKIHQLFPYTLRTAQFLVLPCVINLIGQL